MTNSPPHIHSGKGFHPTRSGVAKVGVALVLFFLLFTGVVGTTPASDLTPLKLYSATLPSGVGKVLVYKYCFACHGFELTRQRLEQLRGLPLEQWENLLSEMIDSWGATIERHEIGPVSRYLFENYGPNTVSDSPPSGAALEEFLPPGPEQKIILQKCVACHNAALTRHRLADRAGIPTSGWKKILGRMKGYGVPLTDGETEQLSAYFADSLSKEATPAMESNQELESFLPAGPGKDLILAQCLSCHVGLELKQRIQQQSSSDQYYWERVVSRMRNQWEAPIEENEVVVVAEYLKSHFTRR